MTTAWQDQFDTTVKDLRRIYDECIEPVEQKYQFERFKPSHWTETLKPSKPFVLFLGPFSAGKSTFINYLLGQDYLWTGPQPTTDKFTVIMHGREYQTLSGRILCASQELPFRSLSQFGDSFLETLQGIQCPVELLRSVTLIDTPGILEAASDIHSRNYNYIQVCKWFIDRADLVFCMFDPSKLDAGVELQNLFRAMKGKESKMRMVLNKADQVAPQELMRVYGALFWNLSNMIHSTEPPRVYVSSFWNKPYRYSQNQQLFDDEKADLMYDLVEVVPMQCLDKRVSSVLRRALDVQIHAHLVTTMRDKLPAFGKSKATKEMVKDMPKISADVANRFKLTLNDFPKAEDYGTFYDKVHLSELPTFKELEKEAKKKGTVSCVTLLDRAIKQDLPRLLTPIAQAAAKDPRQIRRERERATETAAGSLVPKSAYLPETEQTRAGNYAQNAAGVPPSVQNQMTPSPQAGVSQSFAAQPIQQQPIQQQPIQQQPIQQQPIQQQQQIQQPLPVQQPIQQPQQQMLQTPMQPQQNQMQPQQFAPTVMSPQQPMQQQQQGMQTMPGMQPMQQFPNQMGFQPQAGMMMTPQGMMMPQQNMMGMQQPMMMNGMMQPQMGQMQYGMSQMQPMQPGMQPQGMQPMQPMQPQGMQPMQPMQPQQTQMYQQPQQSQMYPQFQPQPQEGGTVVQGQVPTQMMVPQQQQQQQVPQEMPMSSVKEVPMPPPQQDGEGGGSA